MPDKLHLLIFGRVQGVSFRAFVKNKAENLKLTGWVRNNPDGTVECEIVGEKQKVSQMQKRLARGPLFAKVDKVRVLSSEAVAKNPYFGFEIRSSPAGRTA